MLTFFFMLGCHQPCESPLPSSATLLDHFLRMDSEQCLHREDIDLLSTKMNAYHKTTTLHCDQVWRRSSLDGKWFDGPAEKVLDAASVPDVWIESNGSHVIAYNNVQTGLLVHTALSSPQSFWRMGLIGYGGLGLAIDKMDSSPIQYIQTDLHLRNPQEVVDPDIGRAANGKWRLVWFGVTPKQMNPQAAGPLNSAKPHHFYRAESATLANFPKVDVILRSSHGSTGGADPTILQKKDGTEILMIGPLDRTVMAWPADEGWKPDVPPGFNTGAPLASPDAIMTKDGTYRLYGMKNGSPGTFIMYESKDGRRWRPGGTVYKDPDAFNISIAYDSMGTWWMYYNKADPVCLKKWGSKRVLPQGAQGTPILPR